MTDPHYRPKRGREEQPDSRPPLTQRVTDMMRPRDDAGSDAHADTPVPVIGGQAAEAGAPPHNGAHEAAARWIPTSGWMLWELGAVLALVLVSSLIEGWLLRAPVVAALPMATQLIVRGSVVLVYYAILFAFVWWLAARRGRPLAEAVGLRPFEWGASMWRVLIYLVLVRAAGYVYAAALYFAKVEIPGQATDLTRFFGAGLTGIGMTVLIAGLIGPLVEEIVFRGVVFGALSDLLPRWLAVALSAAIFAGLHLNPYLIVPAFIVGVALALVYARSESLWPAVILHSLYNLTSIVLAYSYLFTRGH